MDHRDDGYDGAAHPETHHSDLGFASVCMSLQPGSPLGPMQHVQLCCHDDWPVTSTAETLVIHLCGADQLHRTHRSTDPGAHRSGDGIVALPSSSSSDGLSVAAAPAFLSISLLHNEPASSLVSSHPTPEPPSFTLLPSPRVPPKRRLYDIDEDDDDDEDDGPQRRDAHANAGETPADDTSAPPPKRRRFHHPSSLTATERAPPEFVPNHVVKLGFIPLYAHPEFDTPSAHHRLCRCDGWFCRATRLVSGLLCPAPFPQSPNPTTRLVRLCTCRCLVVVVLVISAGLSLVAAAILLYPRYFAHQPSSLIPPPAPAPAVRDLDLFDRLITFDLLLASIPRYLLLGDFRSRPDKLFGPAHDFRNRSDPFFSRAQPPSAADVVVSEPFTLNSANQFVPESYFLLDLSTVVEQLCVHLVTIADHGPPNFRFSAGISTQFRWSTSDGSFVGSHAALPTLSWSPRPPRAEPTVPGFDPDDNLFPTARPQTPWDIRNLDPPLSNLCESVLPMISDTTQVRSLFEAELLVWGMRVPLQVRKRMNTLVNLRQAQSDETYGGSDRDRLRLLRQISRCRGDWVREGGDEPLTTSGSTAMRLQTPPPSAPATANHRPAYDTTDVPPSFIAAWEAHMRTRTLHPPAPSAAWDVSRNCSANLSFEEPPSRDQWIASQPANSTASDLRALILDSLSALDLTPDDAISPDKLSPEALVVRYSSMLKTLSSVILQLHDRLTQVTSSLPRSGLAELSLPGNVLSSIVRVHDVAPFLGEIAIPRLDQMRLRADNAVGLLKHGSKMQQSILKTLESETSWAVPRGSAPGNSSDKDSESSEDLLAFPSLKVIFANMMLEEHWLVSEERAVDEQHSLREEAFLDELDRASQRRLSNMSAGKETTANTSKTRTAPGLIYSRWYLGDNARGDPYGSQKLRWGLGAEAEAKKGKEDGSKKRSWFAK